MSKGSMGTLEEYLERNRLPFRWDNHEYGNGDNCHSFIPLEELRHLTPLEELL
jgi:hypothetical protein